MNSSMYAAWLPILISELSPVSVENRGELVSLCEEAVLSIRRFASSETVPLTFDLLDRILKNDRFVGICN